jgi:hypothetical protein
MNSAISISTTMHLETLPQRRRQRKHVTFSNVHIIEFPYIIGHNPCNAGVPIGADIVAQHQTSFRIDFFETYRPERRPKSLLQMSADDRRAL